MKLIMFSPTQYIVSIHEIRNMSGVAFKSVFGIGSRGANELESELSLNI